MKQRISVLATFHALVFSVIIHPVGAEPLLKAGDRMVFLGDSITEQQVYPRYVMDYFALRNPGVAISFRNAGWSGDTAPGGATRLQRDVLDLKPTVVSICFGMNDGRYKAFDQTIYDAYMKGMTNLVAQLRAANVKIVLLTPGCVDTDRNPKLKECDYNDTLAKLAAGVKELAARENLPVFDIHALMLDVQTKAKAENPQFTMIPDAIHPTATGAAVMAYGLLKALGCTEQASSLTIDAAKSGVTTDRCVVTGLKVATNSIHFTRTDAALPTYFDSEVASIYKYFPVIDDLNQYTFKVTGLHAGTWRLTVKGMDIGKFTTDQLAHGVNLATFPGPWQTLAAQVNTVAAEEQSTYYARWRQVQLIRLPEEAKPEQDALLRKLDQIALSREAARRELTAKDRTWEWSLDLTP